MPTMLYMIIGSVGLMVIWFVFSSRQTSRKKKIFKDSKRTVSDNFEQNISQILKFASQDQTIKPTVTQWLTQYENISALQIRLLQATSRTSKSENQQNFAHKMIEKQKQEIEKNAKNLLVALKNKDARIVRLICEPTLEKREAVARAMQKK